MYADMNRVLLFVFKNNDLFLKFLLEYTSVYIFVYMQ